MKSSSFMLPEVEFWCSPAKLGLEVGERPGGSNITTTDPCVMDLDLDNNDTQCSRYQPWVRQLFPQNS